MKILIVGGGGREHAIAWKLSKENNVEKIYCAPGNAGIAKVAQCVNISDSDIENLVKFAKENNIDLTVVGPEVPLVNGIVDEFEKEGLKIFGPNKECSTFEGSKSFSKDFMIRHNIPTAKYKEYTNLDEAISEIDSFGYPVVIKADGLAAGKGVVIPENREDAINTLKEMMSDKKFGSAGDKVVIEEFLSGIETSILAFVDNDTIVPMVSAKDHKKVYNFEKGPNTGGMGTFSPSPFYTDEVDEFCRKYVYQPTVDAMAAEGRPFKGIIFFGLMLTADGPKVLEYNARFGDPEAQVVLPRMKNDIVEVMEACIDGKLDQMDLQFEDNAAVCVVLASDGYPVKYEKGIPMYGFENFKDKEGYYCFHAGTKQKDGQIVTNGGRVLGITATGKDLKEARKNAYAATEWISFANKYMRHDIGKAIDEA